MPSQLEPELLRSFMEEARGYLPALRETLNSLRAAPGDQQAIEEMYRLAHSIRSAGQMVGLDRLSSTARGVEDLLAPDSQGEMRCDESLLSLLEAGLAEMEDALADPSSPPPETEPALDPEEIAGELLDSFLEEAEEHLQVVGRSLREAEKRADRRPLLREIRRGVHTIKGAAGMVGLRDIKRLSHRMEDVLDLLYEGRATYTPACHQLLSSTYDALCDMVGARGRTAPFRPIIEELLTYYGDFLSEPISPASEEPPHAGEPGPSPEAAASDPALFVRVPFERLDALVRLVGEIFVNSSAFEQYLTGYTHEIDELELNQARMRRIAAAMETRCATFTPGIAGLSQDDSHRGEFDALEFDRYTELHLLSRDLNEATNDLAAVTGQMKLLRSNFDGFLTRQGRLSGELQDKLIRLRMVPLATLANRLHRTVRVTARQRGKLAELILDGTSTELDKTVMEQLAGPIEHLLRNAVDHGIEEPAARRATGKPESGIIQLSAAYEGTQVVVRLTDDGAGLDLDKIRAMAVQLGYYTDADLAAVSDQALYDLVFEPGFSTASTVSELSGRGVGLDVVKAGVESLKGAVSLESHQGRGVAFTIRLPMTLVITKVLMVEANQERLAIPLAAVTQATRIDLGALETAGLQPMVRLEDRVLPVVHLAELLGLRQPGDVPSGRQPLVVVRAGGHDVAFLVDRILEAREVIVKPLEGLLRKVPRMTGATILGDGSVVLILNPAELAATRPQAAQPVVRRRAPVYRAALEILIVDDSTSVRRAVSNLVRNAGWVPIQAKDGVEALEVLQRSDRRPDAILMDIEMPRMDGYELTAALRAQAAHQKTPIIMLTSRSGDKHRRKAMEAGASEYLVKPYQDDALLEVVRRSVEESRKVTQVA